MEAEPGTVPTPELPPAPRQQETTRGCAIKVIVVVLILLGTGYLLLPQVARVKEAGSRMRTTSHLKQLALAMHTYHDVIGHLPGANASYLEPKDGIKKFPVSWRVLILPYIEQENLFNDYHFDEPWDGPNNIRLLNQMPKIFRHPKADSADVPAGYTHYRVLVSPPGAKPSAIFTDGLPGPKLLEMPDGASNTVLIVEAAEAVPWTMPEVLLYDRNQPVPKLGGLFKNHSLAAFADGSARSIRSDLPDDKLRAWITKDGGENTDDE